MFLLSFENEASRRGQTGIIFQKVMTTMLRLMVGKFLINL